MDGGDAGRPSEVANAFPMKKIMLLSRGGDGKCISLGPWVADDVSYPPRLG